MKICGIYKIISPSGNIYIGQSTDIIKGGHTFPSSKGRKLTQEHKDRIGISNKLKKGKP